MVMDKMDEFFQFVAPTVEASTLRVVYRSLWSLRRGLAGSDPTPQTCLQWLRSRLTTDRVSHNTLVLERIYANRFFNWCVDMGYMEKNPLKPVPRISPKLLTRPVITDAQFAALKRAAIGTPLLDVMIVSWFTGARLVDVCNLVWDNLNFETNELTYLPRKTKKSGRTVTLPISGELREVFAARWDLRDPDERRVFPVARVLHLRGDGTLQKKFRKIANQVGLPKEVTFHCFRHTRATRMLNHPDCPVDLLTAADILGLSSLATLRRYNHTSIGKKSVAMGL